MNMILPPLHVMVSALFRLLWIEGCGLVGLHLVVPTQHHPDPVDGSSCFLFDKPFVSNSPPIGFRNLASAADTKSKKKKN